ncbi:hypothetical protein DPEC_G00135380 [Dallia pectoralis]|uniref:Uncharacterized protein n=1 Tax=Dallia pectoralis TaxID=75939 RepID=A0ACC2GL87_DALPE|nr:hypothetical protein DPEC_G00135380 [Dallia pectoralis]
MARAPARAYVSFTRVNGRTEAITAATPRLEKALSALFSASGESVAREKALSPHSEGPVHCPVTGQSVPLRSQTFRGPDITGTRLIVPRAWDRASPRGGSGHGSAANN